MAGICASFFAFINFVAASSSLATAPQQQQKQQGEGENAPTHGQTSRSVANLANGLHIETATIEQTVNAAQLLEQSNKGD